jgi:hypothetical protein
MSAKSGDMSFISQQGNDAVSLMSVLHDTSEFSYQREDIEARNMRVTESP